MLARSRTIPGQIKTGAHEPNLALYIVLKQQFLMHFSDQSSANDNTQRRATTETTEQHGNLTLFHFQNDQM